MCHWDIVCQTSKVSKNTYYSSIQRLNDLGFIVYTQGVKNTPTKPKIFILQFENKEGIIKEQKGNKEGIDEEQQGNLYKLLNIETINLINDNALLVNENIKNWISDYKKQNTKDPEEEKIKSERFENFWKFYNKGSKNNAKTQFMKLSLEEIDKMSFHVVKYFRANPEKKFRKDAERYISHRLFETEIDLPQQTLPENWWNMDLTPEQWKLVPEDKVQEKKRHDIRRQMGI